MLDNIPATRADVERICLETMREALFDHEMIKEELRQLNDGERVVLPKNKEHAKYMLIIAMNYLGIKPGESLTITKENNDTTNSNSY